MSLCWRRERVVYLIISSSARSSGSALNLSFQNYYTIQGALLWRSVMHTRSHLKPDLMLKTNTVWKTKFYSPPPLRIAYEICIMGRKRNSGNGMLHNLRLNKNEIAWHNRENRIYFITYESHSEHSSDTSVFGWSGGLFFLIAILIFFVIRNEVGFSMKQ